MFTAVTRLSKIHLQMWLSIGTSSQLIFAKHLCKVCRTAFKKLQIEWNKNPFSNKKWMHIIHWLNIMCTNICSTHFTYSSMFENCFICIIIYIYNFMQMWYTHSNNINQKTKFIKQTWNCLSFYLSKHKANIDAAHCLVEANIWGWLKKVRQWVYNLNSRRKSLGYYINSPWLQWKPV
jgi:hypothetical protein